MGDEGSFFGLKVPDGTDRRELYKSQYRGIWTYKMSAAELDEAFRTAVTGDGPDGGWSIKNDERVKYVGKLEVAKGEDQTLKVRAHPCQHDDVRGHSVCGASHTRHIPEFGRTSRPRPLARVSPEGDAPPSLPPSLAPLPRLSRQRHWPRR